MKRQYDKQEIAQLLSKFMAGETSLAEEQVLAQYFRTHEVGEEWTEYKDMLEKLSDKETLTTLMTSQEISGLFGIDPSQCDQLFMFYSMLNPGTGTNTLSTVEFINCISNATNVLNNKEQQL